MAYEFPDFPEPNISAATNCGSSYTETSTDSIITTQKDANYKQTRPRTTRKTRTWKYSWVGVSDDDYATILAFWDKVGRYAAFSWSNPTDGSVHTVRFTEAWSWQYNHPYGWQGTLTFEEV